ncbi:MAG: DUF3093 domain-containing protein [Candidatus Nanopelagicales bacterium]|jgi:hypothetical protein|nr:DUF3093 domain-containing protein [Candidatus Nanopelagicales bacterium]MBJ7394280.1 DUF3093 domain-containing protein [Candidatus Nanopelagicales bacterium]
MNQLLFREKLTPPLWGWVALTGFSLMLAISVSAVFGNFVAIIVFLILDVLFIFIAIRFSPVIKVDDQYLYANKAKLPLKIISQATSLNARQTTKIRGVDADPKCFSATSPLINTAIRIDFEDVADPHTYWLLSTRKPEQLSKVLNQNV